VSSAIHLDVFFSILFCFETKRYCLSCLWNWFGNALKFGKVLQCNPLEITNRLLLIRAVVLVSQGVHQRNAIQATQDEASKMVRHACKLPWAQKTKTWTFSAILCRMRKLNDAKQHGSWRRCHLRWVVALKIKYTSFWKKHSIDLTKRQHSPLQIPRGLNRFLKAYHKSTVSESLQKINPDLILPRILARRSA